MRVRVDHATAAGKFCLDGEVHEVENNVWVVGDDRHCVVIDAPHDVAAVRDLVGDRTVLAVLATHAHDDHIRVAPELADAVDAALESVGLADVAERTAGTYSGGMVRRLELAQALVSSPRLLVLDEPTIGLDPIARAGVWERIEQVRADTGMTVLVTTHYMEEADKHCDRVALMHRGRLRSEGTPEELRAAVGPEATLEDAFRAATGDDLDSGAGEGMRNVRAVRRVARRLG